MSHHKAPPLFFINLPVMLGVRFLKCLGPSKDTMTSIIYRGHCLKTQGHIGFYGQSTFGYERASS